MRLLAFILAVMTVFASFALDCADSVNVRFSVGQRYFDPTLGDNREVMDSFINKVREAAAAGDIERITVYGYASPEGKPRANERLARNRCATIAAYIAAHAGISRDLIEERPGGIGWDELRRLVADNPNVPYQAKVLDILDNTPVLVFDAQGRLVDSRKKQLMDLAGGRPWNWMMVNLYPEVRNAVAISLCRVSLAVDAEEVDVVDEIDVADVTEEVDVAEVAVDSIAVVDAFEEATTMDDVVVAEIRDDNDLPIAIKTNMLYYPVLMPNIEVEWLISDLWSASLEGNVAWWANDKEFKCYRVAIVDAEARRWIRPRAPWHGLYAGAFAGGVKFDLENGTGYQGKCALVGLSVGYVWPIGRRLSLEAAVGAGYMRIHSKKYIPLDGHYLYQQTKNIDYFGPLKVKFSLVWRLGDTPSLKLKK